MAIYRNERTGDVKTVPKELEKKYDNLDHFKRVSAKAATKVAQSEGAKS